MQIKFIIISLLLFVTKFGFTQEPPEMLNIKFKDAKGKMIYPELTIIETSIKPFKSLNNSKDWDNLKIEEDTLVIKDLTENYYNWSKIDSTGYYLSPINYGHYLGEEIRIIAEHNNKKMVITFIGQGMSNFGCWGSDMDSLSLLDISFEQGNFLYAKIHTIEERAVSDGKTISNVSYLLFKGKVIDNFKMIANSIEIDNVENYNGLSHKDQFLPINEVLELNSEYYGQSSYKGFLFENKMPIGFALIINGITKAYLFNEKYQKEIKKYYRQHGI